MYGEQEESIYNIIPPKQIIPEKPAMHRSKHSGKVPPTASTFHQPGTTMPYTSNLGGDLKAKPVPDRGTRQMGKAPGCNKAETSQFLTKTVEAKVQTLSEVKKTAPEKLQPSQLKPKVKPDVPKKEEKPVMNLVTTKNFIVANAVETILSAPRRRPDEAKDYLKKEDYGKVPKYLAHVKQDIQDEYDYIQRLQQDYEDTMKPQVRQVSEGEKLSMIEGLKQKWEQVNKEYQASTHITKLDTYGKIKRKEHFESQLAQIEKDIEKLSKKTILVDAAMY